MICKNYTSYNDPFTNRRVSNESEEIVNNKMSSFNNLSSNMTNNNMTNNMNSNTMTNNAMNGTSSGSGFFTEM